MQPRALLVVAAGCQAATILVTWPLWQARSATPELPLLDLPAVSFGWPLLLSLVLVLIRPRLGAAVHAALLIVAMVFDQTREQPMVISLALLLWASGPARGARTVGALHLAALWIWSGLGKLLSPAFLREGGAWLLFEHSQPGTAPAVAAAVAVGASELALGLLALHSRTRSCAGWLGCALHAGILLYLSPLLRDANPAVWSWNVALALAAPALLCGTSGRLAALLKREGPGPRIAAALFVLLPLGYRAGLVDAPFAHQVYALNGPRALCLRAGGSTERLAELAELRVFLPPVPRVLEAWFARWGRPGDRLVILEERWLARALGTGSDRLLSFTGSEEGR